MLGRSVGNYQLTSKIGEGGMGTVYLARHVTLGRPAAVKVLLPELSVNPDIVTRFFNEARAATAIRSPGIIEVYDFGFLDERCAYIVMEYLEGESLGARIHRGRSTVMAALTIVRAIARALQAAHELGIVHRDLKPDNVFLVTDPDLPSGERVKLLDFGIAKLASSVNETNHTRTGTVIGTPTYMAPEQCRGAGTIDHRADLYALGCVAYEMLCGVPPFVAEGAGDLIARHLYFQPQPLRAHRPDLRGEIEEFVLWLLQKDPGARPGTALDVIQAVDRLAAAAPTVALSSEPRIASVTATRPAVMDTTLSGAVSVSAMIAAASPTTVSRSSRVRVIAGAACATLIVLVLLLRAGASHHEDESLLASGTPSAPHPDVPPPPPPSGGVVPTSPGEPTSGSSRDDNVAHPSEPSAHPADTAPRSPPTIATPPSPEPRRTSESAPKPAADGHSSHVARAENKPSEAMPSDTRPSTPGRPSEVKPPAGAGRSAGCARGAFAAVLDSHTPGEAAVQSALARLQRCKATMDPAVYADFQRRLIAKL